MINSSNPAGISKSFSFGLLNFKWILNKKNVVWLLLTKLLIVWMLSYLVQQQLTPPSCVSVVWTSLLVVLHGLVCTSLFSLHPRSLFAFFGYDTFATIPPSLFIFTIIDISISWFDFDLTCNLVTYFVCLIDTDSYLFMSFWYLIFMIITVQSTYIRHSIYWHISMSTYFQIPEGKYFLNYLLLLHYIYKSTFPYVDIKISFYRMSIFILFQFQT